MAAELKKPTTYDEQIGIMRNKGCIVRDDEFCREKLKEISYYRLSAYFLPYKNSDDTYAQGTTFEKIYRTYEFDRKLRQILFAAVEEVEIYWRSQLSYFHAHQYGAGGYMDAANFSEKHDHDKFVDGITREISNNSNVLFVKHHNQKYNGAFPVWVIMELFTFGMLSRFYGDLKTADQKMIAQNLYNTTPKNIISWLHCCTDLRNICAHYGRLYYRIFPSVPGGLNILEPAKRRLWGCVLALRALYPDENKWNNEVVLELEALINEYLPDISLYRMAFPSDWSKKLRK